MDTETKWREEGTIRKLGYSMTTEFHYCTGPQHIFSHMYTYTHIYTINAYYIYYVSVGMISRSVDRFQNTNL